MTYLEEFPGVLVAVINSNGPAANAKVQADPEVSWLKWHVGTVLLQHHLAVQECALHGTTVHLLWLDHEDGPVLKKIVDNKFSDSVVLKARLHDTFLEISEKSQHLHKFKSKYKFQV